MEVKRRGCSKYLCVIQKLEFPWELSLVLTSVLGRLDGAASEYQKMGIGSSP